MHQVLFFFCQTVTKQQRQNSLKRGVHTLLFKWQRQNNVQTIKVLNIYLFTYAEYTLDLQYILFILHNSMCSYFVQLRRAFLDPANSMISLLEFCSRSRGCPRMRGDTEHFKCHLSYF